MLLMGILIDMPFFGKKKLTFVVKLKICISLKKKKKICISCDPETPLLAI